MNGRVYRCYNADNELIYVGHTSNAMGMRMAAHRWKSPWLVEVKTIQVDEYPTWQQASEAEKVLIAGLRPLHNKACNPDWHPAPGGWIKHEVAS